MANTNEEKKKVTKAKGPETTTTTTTTTTPAAATTPASQAPAATPAPAYQSPYGDQIADLTSQILNRPDFEYNAGDDALWQAYLDKYKQGGKMAMKDSMGQAAALTGGYGSSYSQAVGQQTYDAYMQQAADILPTLEQQAWERYNAEGEKLSRDLGILQGLEETDYGRYTYDQQWAWEQQQANRENLTTLMSTTGYNPTDEELAAAGMTRAEADAISKGIAASDPDYAYRLGLISADRYKELTGKWPTGYTPPAAAGGGGGYDGGNYTYDPWTAAVQAAMNDSGNYNVSVDGYAGPETNGAFAEWAETDAGKKWLEENPPM